MLRRAPSRRGTAQWAIHRWRRSRAGVAVELLATARMRAAEDPGAWKGVGFWSANGDHRSREESRPGSRPQGEAGDRLRAAGTIDPTIAMGSPRTTARVWAGPRTGTPSTRSRSGGRFRRWRSRLMSSGTSRRAATNQLFDHLRAKWSRTPDRAHPDCVMTTGDRARRLEPGRRVRTSEKESRMTSTPSDRAIDSEPTAKPNVPPEPLIQASAASLDRPVPQPASGR